MIRITIDWGDGKPDVFNVRYAVARAICTLLNEVSEEWKGMGGKVVHMPKGTFDAIREDDSEDDDDI